MAREDSLRSRLVAEGVGTALLLIGVVGSGTMAQRLTDDPALQLLQNALATAGVLVAIIVAFAHVSGAHFNPSVTLAERWFGAIDTTTAAAYIAAQLIGAAIGVMIANLMFELPVVNWSTRDRSSPSLIFAEFIATVGLLVVIFATVRSGRGSAVAFVVAGYIAGAYYFASSTSFANPAVTIARTMSDTFAGIAPRSAPGFVLAQIAAVPVAVGLVTVVYPTRAP